MRPKVIFCLFVLFCQYTFAQFKEEKYALPTSLNEISGLEIVNDSVLVAHNDSGNDVRLFFISKKGVVLHTCFISNATNNDWEDITKDTNGNLYIADVGNNGNKRKDLCIYKVKLKDAFEKDTIEAEIIFFTYSNQDAFPPKKENMDFDCEALYCHANNLYLITKSQSKPWKGISTIYVLTTNPGNQSATLFQNIFIGKKGWKFDSVTAADASENRVCILTYNRMIVYTIENDKLHQSYSCKFQKYNQKEALVMQSHEKIIVGAEKHRILGGPYLYLISCNYSPGLKY